MSDSKAPYILLVPTYNEPLVSTLRPLAVAARRRGVVPVVVLREGNRSAIDMFRQLDVEIAIIPPLDPSETTTHLHLLNFLMVIRWLVHYLRAIKAAKLEAKKLFEIYKPAAVICVSEALGVESELLEQARSSTVPGILVQWAHTANKRIIDQAHTERYMVELINQGRRFQRLYVWRRKLGLALLDVLTTALVGRRSPRSLGDGNAQYFAVINQHYANMFVNQGVSVAKIIVTGHPEDDELKDYWLRFNGRTKDAMQLRDHLGIRENDFVVVYAREAISYFRLIPDAQDRQNIRTVLNVLSEHPNARVILRPHPRDTQEQYAWINDEFPNVLIDREANMKAVIALSDLFISQGSSTTRWASILGVPVVLVGLSDLGLTRSMSIMTGVPPAESRAQLRRSISCRLRLGKHTDIPSRPTLVDGQACERILDIALSTPNPG